jgi:hypothetical protein
MKKILFLLAVICGFVYPLRNGLFVITVEDDVITGNTLPRWGVLCQDANVQGNPHDGFAVLYTLPKGEKVRLREQSRGPDHSWVMIAPANWIKGNTLCGW